MTDPLPTVAADIATLQEEYHLEGQEAWERLKIVFAQQDAAIMALAKDLDKRILRSATLERLLEIEQERSEAAEKKIRDMKAQALHFHFFVEKW